MKEQITALWNVKAAVGHSALPVLFGLCGSTVHLSILNDPGDIEGGCYNLSLVVLDMKESCSLDAQTSQSYRVPLNIFPGLGAKQPGLIAQSYF